MKKVLLLLSVITAMGCSTQKEELCDCSLYSADNDAVISEQVSRTTDDLPYCNDAQTKVTICLDGVTLCIELNLLQSQLDLGATLGECTTLSGGGYTYDECRIYCRGL